MTDSTQELDEILAVFANYDDSYEPGYEEGVLSRIDRVKKNILDWHNKQIDELLDRLRLYAVYGEYDKSEDDSEQGEVVPVMAIEAERAKLKEVK